jgi:methionyl-tRNA formyltransferase
VGCIVTTASPDGKRESFYQKAQKTASIFGLNFFLHYSLRFLWRKVSGSGSIRVTLKKLSIPPIDLDAGINHPSSLSKISEFKPDLLVSILGNEIFQEKTY